MESWIRKVTKRIFLCKIVYRLYSRVYRGYKIYKKLIRRYGEETTVLVAPWPGTGDAYQTGRYLNSFLQKNNIGCYILVVGNGGVKKVLDLFSIPNIEVLCFDDLEHLSHLLQFVGENNINLRILHHNPPEMYSSLMRTIEGINAYTWGEMFRDVGLGLSTMAEAETCEGNFTRDVTEEIKAVFAKENLKPHKTVVLSPYANTFIVIPENFWVNLTKYFLQNGYSVCTNCSGEHEKPIPGTVPVFFSYRDSYAFLEYAGSFIGIRSGLCDIIGKAKCKKIILYQPIKCGAGPVIDLFNMHGMGLSDDAIEFEFQQNDLVPTMARILDEFDETSEIARRLGGERMNQYEYKVSAIIPAYNAEKYLYKCLKSIQSQTINELEIIVIDNGSTDGTSKIIDEYSSFDTRVKKISVFPNQGVSNARNEALKRAKGEYIVFSDADDFVPSGAYESMIRCAEKNNSDVVVGDYYEVVDDIHKSYCNTNWSGREAVTFFAGGVIWNKLFRRDFLMKYACFFPNYNFGEDTYYLGVVYSHSPVVTHTATDVYHHLQRTNTESGTVQLTRQYNADNLLDYLECGKKTYTRAYTCDPEDIYIEYLRYLDYVHHFWWENPNAQEQKETFEDLKEFTHLFLWNSAEREADFIKIFHIKPSLFQKITYEVYMSFLVTYYHVDNQGTGHSTAVSGIEPRVSVLDEFKKGEIGFRYIIKYAKAWLRFKLQRK